MRQSKGSFSDSKSPLNVLQKRTPKKQQQQQKHAPVYWEMYCKYYSKVSNLYIALRHRGKALWRGTHQLACFGI